MASPAFTFLLMDSSVIGAIGSLCVSVFESETERDRERFCEAFWETKLCREAALSSNLLDGREETKPQLLHINIQGLWRRCKKGDLNFDHSVDD